MSLLATQADYGLPDGTPGVLYSQGYQDFPFFQARINTLKQKFAPNGQTLLIAGCGFGYAVNYAVNAGYNAFGIDGSTFAINEGKSLLPAIASRLAVADITVANQVDTASRSFGLKGGTPKYALLMTEDVLPCLSDAEIQTALTVLRARSSSNLLHLVTPGNPGDPGLDSRLNWKPLGEGATIPAGSWRALLCPPDIVGSTEDGLYWNSTGQV